ncbi:O-antigen ligase family protein [Priestia aryabhattai]|uniref:O-antigen ligase family protein n=1 Tax=Priestia aryabhattai TaxID=412384 RepID=UPI002E22B995|nr:O-antigen ligase family protein [Priestia aryabhattai]
MDIIVKSRTRLILLFSIIGLFIGVAVAVQPMYATLGVLACLGVVIFLKLPIRITLFIMAAIIFIDISPVKLSGSYIRLHQLLFLAYFVQFVYLLVKNKNLQLQTPLMWSLFFWFITFFLSIEHLISKHDMTVVLIGQLYMYIFYFVVYHHAKSLEHNVQLKVISVYIKATFIVGVLGYLHLALMFAGFAQNGFDNLGIPRPSSLLREPDWYGLMCSYMSIFLLVLMVHRDKRIKIRRFNFMFFVFLGGMILSAARASWISFVVGLLVLFLTVNKNAKINVLKYVLILGLTGLIAGLAMIIAMPDHAQVILNRINPSTSLTTDDGAANSRMASIEIMKYYISQHPWTGNGVGGMNLISQTPEIVSKYIDGEINSGRGNANLILTSMFDSGLIGTSFLVCFLITYIVVMYRGYKNLKDPIILAFLISFISLITDFMFNNGIRFGFFWFHLGLSFAYLKVKKDMDRTNF